MSNIFKIHRIINDNTKHIYVFVGNNEYTDILNNVKIFSESEIQRMKQNNITLDDITLIKRYIHKDDSIDIIKQKITTYTDLRISKSQIYMFFIQNKLLNPTYYYNQLTQNESFALTKDKICDLLLNIVHEPKSKAFKGGGKNFEKKENKFQQGKNLVSKSEKLNLDEAKKKCLINDKCKALSYNRKANSVYFHTGISNIKENPNKDLYIKNISLKEDTIKDAVEESIDLPIDIVEERDEGPTLGGPALGVPALGGPGVSPVDEGPAPSGWQGLPAPVDNICKNIFNSQKDSFDFDDLINMEEFDWDSNKYITTPLGIKLVFKDKYIFTANPFNCISIDLFIKREINNILTTQNNSLLFEYGEIFQNNLYITLCEDVLENTKLNHDYIMRLYFPALYKKNIFSLKMLQEKKHELFQEQKENKSFKQYNEIIDTLFDIYDKKNKPIPYLKSSPGITEITFTIHPIYNIVFPLEILFKIIHSTKEIPIVKFNPGKKNENIYRLFTEDNISRDGRKIPFLYTSNSNKKNKIFRLSRRMGLKKRVSFYIEFIEDTIKYKFLCEFEQNGNIQISTVFSEPKKIDLIERLVQKHINEPIIKVIKNFLEQSGYTYIQFNRLADSNIEINKITYAFGLELDKQINFKPVMNCLSSICNVLKMNNDEIHMIYKRVGNFNIFDSQQTFINELKKQGVEGDEIINGLMSNFKLTLDNATKKFIEWASDVRTEQGLFANKKLTILTNTGFPIFIKRNKINNITTIKVQSINNINYIQFIEIYIDSIMRLIIDKKTTDVSPKLLTICSNPIIQDIEKEIDITGKVESSLLDRAEPNVSTSGEITFDNEDDTDFLNLIMGDEEDSSNEEDSSTGVDNEVDIWDEEGDIWDEEEDLFSGEEISGPTINQVEEHKENKSIHQNDLEGVHIKGNKSIFMQKKLELDPKLFLKNEQGRYKAYSRSCSSSKAKQPIILTDEELKYINKKDKEFGIKSYDQYLTYGSPSSKKKNHYICPRYWCMSDNEGKSRSISLEEINTGKCGGWDAVIPEGSNKVPKGKRIYEFTDTRWHKSGTDTKNRLVYKPMFPGYQDSDKHPDGLCVPCCFTKPSGLPQEWKKITKEEKKNWILLKKKDLENIKNTDEFKSLRPDEQREKLMEIKKNLKENIPKWSNSITSELSSKMPTILINNMYKPVGNGNEGKGPTFDVDENNNIMMETIKGEKQRRENPSESQINKFKSCDQEDSKINESGDIGEKTYGAPLDGDESFPILMGQLGYLPMPVVLFLQYYQQNVILSQVGRNLIINENNKPPPRYKTGLLSEFCKQGQTTFSYLLRKGVETHDTQSFLACIADAYGYIETPNLYKKKTTLKTKPVFTIQKFKERIIETLTLDTFIKLQNGNLVRVFYKEKNITIDNYIDSNIISYLSNIKDSEIYIYKIISAYENFIDYLNDDKVIIDYEFLWDLLCMDKASGGLFNYGLNLFILNSPTDDITQKIEVICPTNHFNNEHFSSNKPLLILYSRDGYYEPIYRYTRLSKNKTDKKDNYFIMKTFNIEIIQSIAPEISNIIFKIRDMLIQECKPLPSLPDRYKFRENLPMSKIKDFIIQFLPDYEITSQVLNYNSKAVALILNTNIYLPILPSSFDPKLQFVYIDTYIASKYTHTLKYLTDIYNLTRNNIPCNPKMKVVDHDMVVGIITETNQFVPIIPTPYTKDDLEPIFDTTVNKDKFFLLTNDIDDERALAIKKIKLETNFYNVFRNTLRMIMDDLKMKKYRNELTNICQNITLPYHDKLEKINKLLQIILTPFIEFTEFKIHQLKDINSLSKCIGLEKNKCHTNCTFSDNESKCKLLLPKNNLLSNTDNYILYFKKLADELIRYKMIQNFILKPKTYLSFQRINYELNNNEIILLEDLLYNEYFEKLIPIPSNEYINHRNTYDTAIPSKTISYSNKYNSDALYTEINTNCIKENDKKLSLNFWKKKYGKKGIDDTYNIFEFQKNNKCSWELFNQILKKEGIISTIDNIRDILIEQYKKLRNDYDIFRIIKQENKIINFNHLDSGTDMEVVITIHNYYLTVLDFFVLSKHFKIDAIILTGSGNLKVNGTKKCSWLTGKSYCYIIYSASWSLPNIIPNYGLISKNNDIQIPISDLKSKNIYQDMTEKNIDTVDDFITMANNPVKKKMKLKLGKVIKKTTKKLNIKLTLGNLH